MGKQISKKGESGSNWSIPAMFIGMFFGIFTFVFIGGATFTSNIFLSKVLALFCFVGLLIPFRFYKKWFGMSKVEASLFNIMGVGPTICALLLWTNYLIRSGEKVEVFPVLSSQFYASEHIDNIKIIFNLENKAYEEYPEFRTISLEEGEQKKEEAQKLKIKTAEGLLGYRIFLGNETVME